MADIDMVGERIKAETQLTADVTQRFGELRLRPDFAYIPDKRVYPVEHPPPRQSRASTKRAPQAAPSRKRLPFRAPATGSQPEQRAATERAKANKSPGYFH